MSVFPQQNGLTGLGNHYMNGGDHSPSQFPLYGGGGGGGGTSTPTKLGSTSTSSTSTSNSGSREDELDFDPIQETQKAFAEMMANEQQQKQNGTARQHQQQQNGGSSYLPPPPPGFVQPTNTHMNSFGTVSMCCLLVNKVFFKRVSDLKFGVKSSFFAHPYESFKGRILLICFVRFKRLKKIICTIIKGVTHIF